MDEITRTIIEDAGVDPNDAILILNEEELKIEVKATKKNYSKIL
jgi:hypothetical protein